MTAESALPIRQNDIDDLDFSACLHLSAARALFRQALTMGGSNAARISEKARGHRDAAKHIVNSLNFRARYQGPEVPPMSR